MTRSSILPPTPPKIIHKEIHHGIYREDPYHWLRASNWQDVLKKTSCLDENIRYHLEMENAYQSDQMADTKSLQDLLFLEMKSRIQENDCSVPIKHGPFAYGVSYVTGGQQPHYFRTPRNGGEKDVYLNGDVLANGKDYFKLGSVQISPNHAYAAWTYDDKGSEYYTAKIHNFEVLPYYTDTITDISEQIVWDANSEGFFYTKMDKNHRPSELYYHRLNTDQAQDKLIFCENDPGFFLHVSGSKLNDFIYINIHDHETSEIWLIPANAPFTPPQCVRKREKGIEYSLAEGDDVFYILTNRDNAKDFKIMVAPCISPQSEHWSEIVPHQLGRLILFHDAYQEFLIWLEQFEGLPRIQIMDRATKQTHSIAFTEEAYSLDLQGAAEYNSQTIRFSYSSMTTPNQIFDYEITSRKKTLLKTQKIPSGHNQDNYIIQRIMATAHDGEKIPISLFYHKTIDLNGKAPCLLYGYGAYGISIPANFNSNILSLVNRGFIYAIAHIRGGKEKGTEWYEKGKHLFKKNTFNDFIACGRHLVNHKFTSHDRLIAYGGSAGGMLMGAIANIAPQDFSGIIANVPFVDVLTTMLDASLPLTPPEWPEWGNPLESEEDYNLIASYSPYDNIKAQQYPPILAIAGLTDPRVTYWEPAKWVAKLRDLKTDDNAVLLRINMDTGHAGAAGRFAKLEEIAYIYAYMLKIVGKNNC
ncbi:S9 family peptidase [Bartonella sp. 1-1C]|uniref:S9 family peptidase n=1 Tax=Bartonella sp. 1-1C TaxID=515256 RepID=UPI0001F4BA56|nr:S9 family peptidase [Bartonella sp. 1-1C]ATO57714.1 oligopeptidase B Serine peptidase, MEROPS familyS09A [Bartonella sp. 1-1C]CBI80520.1 Protease II [Bartonella sp. 1-1C]